MYLMIFVDLVSWSVILCFLVNSGGSKLKDFLATIQTDANIQSEIAKIRQEVEEFAKQFPTIGFEKETMKYKD